MSLSIDGWKNKNGTGDRKCKCGSWMQHWINFSGCEWPGKCSVKGCNNAPSLGAHIYKLGERKEYIVPICDSCNKKSESFELKDYVTLVSADKSQTCEK